MTVNGIDILPASVSPDKLQVTEGIRMPIPTTIVGRKAELVWDESLLALVIYAPDNNRYQIDGTLIV